MENIYIVESLRTPFGSFGGTLSTLSAPELGASVIRTLIDRVGLDGSLVDEVIMGHVIAGGSGQAPARQAMRGAGLPDSVGALTINKVCGSGLKSMMIAASSIASGESDIVVAGGMESMSKAPYALMNARFGMKMGDGKTVDLLLYDALSDPYSGRHMGELTEATIASRNITRKDADEYALRSYKAAQKAVSDGLFDDEIAPVTVSSKKGDAVIDKDEEPFRVDFDRMESLRPVFLKDGTITAANASTINDGAGAALIAGEAAVKRYGLTPKARIVASATNSHHPDDFSVAPTGAMRKVLERAGLSVSDIDLFEVNEAFAAVPLMAAEELSIDMGKMNVNGGAVSLGHPVGASGARLVATLLPELKRRGGRFGLVSLCIGGGEAVAMIIERI